jgi:hypothetical protein
MPAAADTAIGVELIELPYADPGDHREHSVGDLAPVRQVMLPPEGEASVQPRPEPWCPQCGSGPVRAQAGWPNVIPAAVASMDELFERTRTIESGATLHFEWADSRLSIECSRIADDHNVLYCWQVIHPDPAVRNQTAATLVERAYRCGRPFDGKGYLAFLEQAPRVDGEPRRSTAGLVAVPAALEQALLELIMAGDGRATWHSIATSLPRYRLSAGRDLLTNLDVLRDRGLISDRPAGPGMVAYTIRDEGRVRLDEMSRLAAHHQLASDELATLCAAFRGSVSEAIMALMPFADDGAIMTVVLRRVLAVEVALAERVAFGAAMLPADHRAAFAEELVRDERAQVRAAAFRAWAPARMDVPGQAVRFVPEHQWDQLLWLGLRDPVPEVRRAAAALMFASDRGAPLVDVLMLLLDPSHGSEDRELTYWVTLALGAAHDPRSLERLCAYIDGRDALFAATAVRALAARPDGRARWLAALDDLRPDVHQAAVFALAQIAVDLEPAQLAELGRDRREPVRTALAQYLVRNSSQ